jgi:hypothetical protein
LALVFFHGSTLYGPQILRLFFLVFAKIFVYFKISALLATAGIQQKNFEDSKTDITVGPALLDMNVFQVTVPLIWPAVIQNFSFESAQ